MAFNETFKRYETPTDEEIQQREIFNQNLGELSRTDVFTTAAKNEFLYGTGASAITKYVLASGEEKLEPATLKQMYPEHSDLFTGRLSKTEAQFLVNKTNADRIAQGQMNIANTKDASGYKLAQIAGGFAGALADPIMTPTMLYSGAFFNQYLASRSFVQPIARLLSKGSPKGISSGMGWAENIFQDLVTTSVGYGLSKATRDMTNEDPSLTDEATKAIAMNAFFFGGSRLVDYFRGKNFFNNVSEKQAFSNLPPSIREKIVDDDMFNHYNKAIQDGTMMERLMRNLYNTSEGSFNYLKNGNHYFAQTLDDTLPSTGHLYIGGKFGKGLVLVDNPNIVAETAKRTGTKVHIMGLSQDANLFDLSNPYVQFVDKEPLLKDFNSDVRNAIELAIRKSELHNKIKIESTDTIQSVFEKVANLEVINDQDAKSFFDSMEVFFRQSGFDGYKFNQEGVSSIQLFDPDNFKYTKHAQLDLSGDILHTNVLGGEQSYKLLQHPDMQGLPDWYTENIRNHLDGEYLIEHLPKVKEAKLQAPEGYLSNGKKITMKDGYFISDPLYATDEVVHSGYVEYFSKEHMDEIRNTLITADNKGLKKLADKYPQITKQVQDNLMEIETYYQSIYIPERAYERAGNFLLDNLHKLDTIPSKDIKQALSDLYMEPVTKKKFMLEVDNYMTQQKAHSELQTSLMEDFNKLIHEEENKAFKQKAISVLAETRAKEIAKNKDIKELYSFLKEYDKQYTKSTNKIAKGLWNDLKKTVAKSDKLEKTILDKGSKIKTMVQNGLEEQPFLHDIVTQEFKKTIEDLKVRNPDHIETIIKAAEFCLRRNT